MSSRIGWSFSTGICPGAEGRPTIANVAHDPVTRGDSRVINPRPPMDMVSTGVDECWLVMVQVASISWSTSPVFRGVTATFATAQPRSCISTRRRTRSSAGGVAVKSWRLPTTGTPAFLAAAMMASPTVRSKWCSTSTASDGGDVEVAVLLGCDGFVPALVVGAEGEENGPLLGGGAHPGGSLEDSSGGGGDV